MLMIVEQSDGYEDHEVIFYDISGFPVNEAVVLQNIKQDICSRVFGFAYTIRFMDDVKSEPFFSGYWDLANLFDSDILKGLQKCSLERILENQTVCFSEYIPKFNKEWANLIKRLEDYIRSL